MDALGNFLKIALYRVIAVLIVGIPAVEIFSHIFLGNGIVIQQVDNETIPAKVKFNIQNPDVNWYNIQLPGNFYFSPPKNGKLSIEIPIADIRINDPSVEIHNSNILQIGRDSFKFNELPTVGWVFYIIIAWILGEILCFLGKTLIGFSFFDFRPFDLRIVEKN